MPDGTAQILRWYGKGEKTLGVPAAVNGHSVTAILNANLSQTLRTIAQMKEKYPDYNGTAQIFRSIRLFPEAYACSYWPFFKVFSLLTCALILFSKQGRGKNNPESTIRNSDS